MGSRPTLKDIAKLANCSTAVVSTVVNNAKGNTLVSDEMRRRVRKAAAELGYRPNFASRSLVRQSVETIGLYVPPAPGVGLGMPYEGAIISGLEQACQEHGYDLLAINLSGKSTHEDCGHKFAEGRIDGLVLLHIDHNATWIDDLVAAHRNVVAVNFYGKAKGLTTINFDDIAAVRIAVEHLVTIGHRRIGWIGDPFVDLGPGAKLRRVGYEQAMTEAGLMIDPKLISDYNPKTRRTDADQEQAGAAAVRQVFDCPNAERPTAVVCYNDMLAAGAMYGLARMGITVPDQVSVIGVDDSEVCRFTAPKLTSIRQPLEMMGYQAASSLIDGNGKNRKPRISTSGPDHLLSEPKLVVRESTCPLTS